MPYTLIEYIETQMNFSESALLFLVVVFGIAVVVLSSKIPWNCYTGPGACCPSQVPPSSHFTAEVPTQVAPQSQANINLVPMTVLVNGQLMQLVPVTQQTFQVQQPVMTMAQTNFGINNQAAVFPQPAESQEALQQKQEINITDTSPEQNTT